MRFPAPEDPADAPVWENYCVAQVAQAALGIIPRTALAVGVEVDGARVRVRFQLSACDDETDPDIEEILDRLRTLVGDEVAVDQVRELLDLPRIDPRDGVRWVYVARHGGERNAPDPNTSGPDSPDPNTPDPMERCAK